MQTKTTTTRARAADPASEIHVPDFMLPLVPTLERIPPRLRGALFALGVVALIGLAVDVSGMVEKMSNPPVATTAFNPVAFEVPSLLGKNIDQVQAAIGKPTNASADVPADLKGSSAASWTGVAPVTLSGMEWDNGYRKLEALFDPTTRAVSAYLLTFDMVTSYLPTRSDDFLTAADIKSGNPHFSVTARPDTRPGASRSAIQGILIVPRST